MIKIYPIQYAHNVVGFFFIGVISSFLVHPYDSNISFLDMVSSLALRHMMTSSNGNIFRVTGLLCGNSLGTGEFASQRPVTLSFDVFFDMRLNQQLSKQWRWRWFVMPSCSLWHHCNELCDWPSGNKSTLNKVHKSFVNSPQQNTTKHQPYAYIWGVLYL